MYRETVRTRLNKYLGKGYHLRGWQKTSWESIPGGDIPGIVSGRSFAEQVAPGVGR